MQSCMHRRRPDLGCTLSIKHDPEVTLTREHQALLSTSRAIEATKRSLAPCAQRPQHRQYRSDGVARVFYSQIT
eukprot:8871938-Pyramimonas_sp.AAC.2